MSNPRLPEHLKVGDIDAGAPLWMVSFADMTLLLLCFFILLLSVSHQEQIYDEDVLRILAAIKVGFGYKPDDKSETPIDKAVLQVLSTTDRSPRSRSQIRWTSPAVEGSDRKTNDSFGWAKGQVGRPILFEGNSARILPRWNYDLEEIAEVVRHHYREIVIEGHCSQEEAKRDPDGHGGHYLAYLRALEVKKELESRGVAAARMRLVTSAAHDTAREERDDLRQRAVVTLGTYYLPGGRDRPRPPVKTDSRGTPLPHLVPGGQPAP